MSNDLAYVAPASSYQPEHRILPFIKKYISENGFPPSIREIAADGQFSRSTVVLYLELLEAHGFIQRQRGVARGIKVLR